MRATTRRIRTLLIESGGALLELRDEQGRLVYGGSKPSAEPAPKKKSSLASIGAAVKSVGSKISSMFGKKGSQPAQAAPSTAGAPKSKDSSLANAAVIVRGATGAPGSYEWERSKAVSAAKKKGIPVCRGFIKKNCFSFPSEKQWNKSKKASAKKKSQDTAKSSAAKEAESAQSVAVHQKHNVEKQARGRQTVAVTPEQQASLRASATGKAREHLQKQSAKALIKSWDDL